MFLPHTWNNGIVECWDVVFKGGLLFFEMFSPILTINYSTGPISQLPHRSIGSTTRRTKPNIPSFHYSNIPIMSEAN
jgi:hypothetical protein